MITKKLMEKVTNKDIKKLLVITLCLGFMFGVIYLTVLNNYIFPQMKLNFEFINGLEAFKRNFNDYADSNESTLRVERVVNVERVDIIHKSSHENIPTTKAVSVISRVNGSAINQSTTIKSIVGTAKNEPSTSEMSKKQKCKFDKENLGPIHVDDTPVDLLNLHKDELDFVQHGGQWSPTDCIPREELAVVIPYRQRETHLGIFLRHMHKMFKKQMIKYRIFVIEQDDEYDFNRGKLMNVGYKEALLRYPFTCFVFHDVDLMPEDSRNDYACPGSPRHMSVAVDKFEYELLYEQLFGGVEMFKTEHFHLVNGFSSSFWGWGAEDDNLYFRVSQTPGLKLSRPSIAVGRYKMLKHFDMEDYGPESRHTILENSMQTKYIQSDGLNNLQYKVKRVLELPLFTLIKVDLQKHKDKMLGQHEYF